MGDGRHAGVSDNNVVHVGAEAHATQSTDRIERRAGSSEGVKKIKEKHPTTGFVNIERKDDERNADDDCTSGNVQNDGTLHPRGNKKSRRHSLSPKTPMQLRTEPKRATPIVFDQSLVQSTTTDVRDEKSAEDDAEEDELIIIPSPQKPSPRYRAEEQSRTDWEALISRQAGTEGKRTCHQTMADARTIHLFAALHGHTPIGRNHGVRHRHLEAGNIRRAYLHHIRSTEVRSIGGHVANQRQHDNLHHSLARAVDRHSCTRRASWHRRNHPGNKQRCTLYAMRVIWQSFVDDGVVKQSKLSNNAHEALSRSQIELNSVKEDTLSALT